MSARQGTQNSPINSARNLSDRTCNAANAAVEITGDHSDEVWSSSSILYKIVGTLSLSLSVRRLGWGRAGSMALSLFRWPTAALLSLSGERRRPVLFARAASQAPPAARLCCQFAAHSLPCCEIELLMLQAEAGPQERARLGAPPNVHPPPLYFVSLSGNPPFCVSIVLR